MSKKQELLDYIMSLTPEQVEKVTQRMDLLEMVVNMNECEALYSTVFLGKMFFKA